MCNALSEIFEYPLLLMYYCIGGGGGGILVDTLTGETILLEMGFSSTIESIKKEVQNQTGVSTDQLQLRFNGKQLDDGFTLSDYNFQCSSRLLLVKNFQG